MEHRWTYRNGRSFCDDCGAWAPDLRCCPGLRQQGGHYPTLTDLQNKYACPVCWANIRVRIYHGELRAICDGTQAHDTIKVGRAIPKDKRDYLLAQQEADAVEVLDGLPPELRALVAN